MDDYISEDNPVRVIEAFVDELDLKALGFEGIEPPTTGRPASVFWVHQNWALKNIPFKYG
ncbi:MAG: hypothetical protein ACREV4_00785 [Gammaproteobacteria bacterium]